MIERYRDLQLIEKDGGTYLAVACDVSAGIGSLEHDVVKVSPKTAGYYAAAVPMIELLAVGARPISVVDTIGVPMSEMGREIIDGVKQAMAESSIPEDCLTGSTEDNIPTVNTSIGITVIAELSKVMLKSSVPVSGEAIYVAGIPKMGQRFLEEEILGKKGEVMDLATVKAVRAMDGISHILPVGSKGIRYELELLKGIYGFELSEAPDQDLDMLASAGPATCMLVACNPVGAAILKEKTQQPVHFIGDII